MTYWKSTGTVLNLFSLYVNGRVLIYKSLSITYFHYIFYQIFTMLLNIFLPSENLFGTFSVFKHL